MSFAKTALTLVLATGLPFATVVGLGTFAATAQESHTRADRADRTDRANRSDRADGPRGLRGGRLAMVLEQFDTNGDGGLTQEEVTQARAAQLAQFDADGDGVLTLEEYQALWLAAMRERMVDRFQAHDDDGTGTITLDEFQEDVARLVARGDRNGDGVLDRADVQRGGERARPSR